MSKLEAEQKLVFAVAPMDDGSAPLIIVGVSAAAWDYMKDGKTHHFDLAPIGLPFKLMMFGADTRAAAQKLIEDANAARGHATLHMPGTDFSIKTKPGH